MHWHHALVCTRTSHDIGCECMVWVDPMFSVDFRVNRLFVLCLIDCRGDMVRSTLRLVSMVGLVARDFVQLERMVLK